ncbi:LysM peptidoglycan-binding domain-containing protein [Psychroserpens sp. BH13MA-6]
MTFTVSIFGAVAQNTVYKDVLLDGKPAKLNVATGEVTLVKEGETTKTSSSDTNEQKLKVENKTTEIQANLLKNDSKPKDSIKAELKMVAIDSSASNRLSDASSIDSTLTHEKSLKGTVHVNTEISKKQTVTSEDVNKATTMVYETSEDLSNTETDTDFHVVKKGETLYALSKRYNTTLHQLQRANKLESTLIKVGQNLRVGNFDVSYANSAQTWLVSKGDTLYSIAKKSHTTVEEIKALNGLDSNLIKVGQVLKLK